ncbi:hypothetical protein KC19_7G181900 [Ceratodon purpureus]|uniref:Secreted protein n=1 Tax=Ceratodon purpureus TaxID=3225 RepID=A0A8T0H9E5_CERPU|nr:hypothetical protein KC19_7G181900 [Ceratodon purpureus]
MRMFCLISLEIVMLLALFCMHVLIPLSVTSNYNQQQRRMGPNFTYSNFDNLGMGNVEVCPLIVGSESRIQQVHSFFARVHSGCLQSCATCVRH